MKNSLIKPGLSSQVRCHFGGIRKTPRSAILMWPMNHRMYFMISLVEYHPHLTDRSDSKRKRIAGIDRPKTGHNGDDQQSVEWRWRGKGVLRLLSSDWRIIGYNLSSSGNGDDGRCASDPDWVITFFRQTLITPTGIDIYSRSPSALPGQLKEQLLEALRNHPANVVSSLVDSMTDIPHDLP